MLPLFKMNTMKKFQYKLLEDRSHLIEQDNSNGDRVYHAPKGSYPSITGVLYQMISKPSIDAWKKKVGEEQAQKISSKAANRGTRVHNSIEKYLRGEEDYLEKVTSDNRELINLALNEIDQKIDNIHGIEMKLWSDDLKVAGTSDLIAEYEGELAIIDWKTATYIKKPDWMKNYILQGTAYSRMLYEMYGLIPKKIVICSLIRFANVDKIPPHINSDLYIDWKVFNPLEHIRELKTVCDNYHSKFPRHINIFDVA